MHGENSKQPSTRELDSATILTADDAAISNTYAVRAVCSLIRTQARRPASIPLTACVLFEGFGVSFPGVRSIAVDVICDAVLCGCLATSRPEPLICMTGCSP